MLRFGGQLGRSQYVAHTQASCRGERPRYELSFSAYACSRSIGEVSKAVTAVGEKVPWRVAVRGTSDSSGESPQEE